MKIGPVSHRLVLKFILGGMAVLTGFNSSGWAQAPVTRIEEDWEMDVVFARDDLVVPQMKTLMSPDGSNSVYFTFEINCTTSPEPEDGGLQVNAWVGDESYDFKTPPTDRTLERSREVIRWTQVIEIVDGNLQFSIVDFQSRSLGNFNQDEQLRVMVPTSMTDLSNYSHQHSVGEAGVPYALNRVNTMMLSRVRQFSGASQVSESDVNLSALEQ